jgi:hypothetical protein
MSWPISSASGLFKQQSRMRDFTSEITVQEHFSESRLSVLLVQRLYSGRRLDPNAIVHCVPDSLLAAEIFLSRLNRNVSKQKLNLLQFAKRWRVLGRPGRRIRQTLSRHFI